jgi:hypothetical protein
VWGSSSHARVCWYVSADKRSSWDEDEVCNPRALRIDVGGSCWRFRHPSPPPPAWIELRRCSCWYNLIRSLLVPNAFTVWVKKMFAWTKDKNLRQISRNWIIYESVPKLRPQMSEFTQFLGRNIWHGLVNEMVTKTTGILTFFRSQSLYMSTHAIGANPASLLRSGNKIKIKLRIWEVFALFELFCTRSCYEEVNTDIVESRIAKRIKELVQCWSRRQICLLSSSTRWRGSCVHNLPPPVSRGMRSIKDRIR